MQQDFEKLVNIGKFLDLSPQEAIVFAYKVLGVQVKDIKKRANICDASYVNAAGNIYQKLEITTTSRKERINIIQELGKEALKEYDDIIAPVVSHNAEQIIAALKKLNEERGL